MALPPRLFCEDVVLFVICEPPFDVHMQLSELCISSLSGRAAVFRGFVDYAIFTQMLHKRSQYELSVSEHELRGLFKEL